MNLGAFLHAILGGSANAVHNIVGTANNQNGRSQGAYLSSLFHNFNAGGDY